MHIALDKLTQGNNNGKASLWITVIKNDRNI